MNNLIQWFLSKLHWVIAINLLANLVTTYRTGMEELETANLQNLELNEQITNTLKKNKTAREFEKNLEVSRSRINEIIEQIEKVKKQLPNTINDTEILELLSNETTLMNMQNSNYLPLKEVKKDFFFSKKYVVKTTGTFLQFLIFLERFGKKDRLFNVESFEMKLSKGPTKGRFKLLDTESVIEVFRFNPSFKEDINDGQGVGSPDSSHNPNSINPSNSPNSPGSQKPLNVPVQGGEQDALT